MSTTRGVPEVLLLSCSSAVAAEWTSSSAAGTIKAAVAHVTTLLGTLVLLRTIWCVSATTKPGFENQNRQRSCVACTWCAWLKRNSQREVLHEAAHIRKNVVHLEPAARPLVGASNAHALVCVLLAVRLWHHLQALRVSECSHCYRPSCIVVYKQGARAGLKAAPARAECWSLKTQHCLNGAAAAGP